MTAGAAVPAAPRLTKQARREQLLDAAAELMVERGPAGITMEGLAERAGVSKALPYQHFENAGGVLVALYRREIALLGDRVTRAVSPLADPAARVRAAIHAYLDVISERGDVLGALTNPASGIAADADEGQRMGVDFVNELLVRPFGISGKRALILASMMLGTLSGAVDSWAHGDGGRERVESLVGDVIVGGLQQAAADGRI